MAKQRKSDLTYQKCAEFVSRFEQEETFNQNIPEIIVKAFFINTTNENCLNPTLIPKMLFSCQLLNRPQLYIYWLTLSWRRSLSYINQSIDLRSKSMDWFLCVGTSVMKDLMHLITGSLIIMTIVKLVTVKLLTKNLIGLWKINKTNKHFGGRRTS